VLSTVTDPIVGFLDESSLQQNPNKRRVINTPMLKYAQGKMRSKTIFGFMAINGNDAVMLSDSSKAEDMMSFIQIIRTNNIMRPICLLLEIHLAKRVRSLAYELDIHFIYFPPYSPDLNPIEFGWKDLKRDLSKFLDFDEAIEMSEEFALKILFSRKDGYSKHVINKVISEGS
jgi:putative transposase